MTVRAKIVVSCLVLTLICTVVGVSAWRSQRRLGALAIDLYDQAFVAQDFLGRANIAFEAYVARRADGVLSDTQHSGAQQSGAGRPGAIRDILINLDIAETRVQAEKTRLAIARLRAALAGFAAAPGALTGASVASIRDNFAHVAHRLSNNGLAKRDTAEAVALASQHLLVTTLCLALAGVAATGLLLIRSVVPPLRQAAADMMRLCRGDTDVVVSGTGRRDEIGDLCRSMGVFRQALIDNRIHDVRFKAALDNMTQGLCLFDAQEQLVVFNSRFAAMFGARTVGCHVSALLADAYVGRIFRPPTAGHLATTEEQFHDLPDGRVIRVACQTMAGAGWVATYEDVTERRRWQEQLSHMARHDALTGLPNRVAFSERIEQQLARARPGAQIAVLYLDLDGFKTINDTLGHPVGDELLRAVAGRLLECRRGSDLVARLGGDEFAIIQADIRQVSDTASLCERIVDAMHGAFCIGGHKVFVGTSIGVAVADEAATADGLLRSADIALYRAKADGRGTWRVFQPEMDAALQARHGLERDVARAIAEREFKLHYQPLIDVTTGLVTGFEALLRWDHPERGMVPPADFIALAEETGLINPIGAWVLQQACADAATWPDHVKVAVNLSPVQFSRKGNLVQDVEDALRSAGLDPGRLELEITESVLLQDSSMTVDILHHLRGLGVRISMDDFGTGYSSLSYLRQFPFDKLKIDQSFVKSMSVEPGSIEIIRAVIGLGRALNMTVLAEGVETEAQLDMLRDEGCAELQGYLFSKPRPSEDLPRIIATYSAPAVAGSLPTIRATPPPRQLACTRL